MKEEINRYEEYINQQEQFNKEKEFYYSKLKQQMNVYENLPDLSIKETIKLYFIKRKIIKNYLTFDVYMENIIPLKNVWYNQILCMFFGKLIKLFGKEFKLYEYIDKDVKRYYKNVLNRSDSLETKYPYLQTNYPYLQELYVKNIDKKYYILPPKPHEEFNSKKIINNLVEVVEKN